MAGMIPFSPESRGTIFNFAGKFRPGLIAKISLRPGARELTPQASAKIPLRLALAPYRGEVIHPRFSRATVRGTLSPGVHL